MCKYQIQMIRTNGWEKSPQNYLYWLILLSGKYKMCSKSIDTKVVFPKVKINNEKTVPLAFNILTSKFSISLRGESL